MKLKKNLWVIIALMMISVSPALASEKKKGDVVKIVYQCDFPDITRIHMMLTTLDNIVNHYQSRSEAYEIDLVAFGPCLQYVIKDFKGTEFEKKPYIDRGGPEKNGTTGRIRNLLMKAGNHMKIIACQNTMKKKNVRIEQMEDYVELTPSGIIKIIDLQGEGYAYVKIM
ncbi:DsrE family protein [Sulfurovum sp. TSL1]|uniref:DsrE family protein n=1 Tax=Sulfurovum sp. TSL1 TaxID=2826994 RepID=UPI001CC53108|nr:DsrE family protein [Sulfurovum sp. TSL1]GIT99189.1 hypothetical protein TSL1_20100 [Sulfurovum sp. TSL1]